MSWTIACFCGTLYQTPLERCPTCDRPLPDVKSNDPRFVRAGAYGHEKNALRDSNGQEAAQQLDGELADAFEQDRGLAEQLTAAQHRLRAAQHRLRAANDRLWSGLHPDALGLVYDGATVGPGASAVAEDVGDAVRSGAAAAEVAAALLGELQEVHWTIQSRLL